MQLQVYGGGEHRIRTVLYVMADKFLDSAEMDELMEVIGMTQLGQKLVSKGREEGKREEADGRLPLSTPSAG